MWWSLRNQILLPFLLILTLAIAMIASATAALSVNRGERQALDQLTRVIDTLGRSSFPFTPAVLEQMRGLSGAHFVVFSDQGRIRATTLPHSEQIDHAWLASLFVEEPGQLDSAPETEVSVGGVHYLAVRLRSHRERQESLLVLYPETTWRQARWDAAIPPLMVGGLAIVLVFLASGWLAHRLGRRLATLRQGVVEIASGDFRALDTGKHYDEITEVVVSLNRMNAELVRMREEIRRGEQSILLSQFAAGLAHQLRNAVTGARLSIQVHGRRCSRPENDRSLEVALRQLSLTEEQLKGLLALGRMEPKPKVPCDLGRLLAELNLLLEPVCEHVHVKLTFRLPETSASVLAERDALLAAILNLALNGIEAAGNGGQVEIQLDRLPFEKIVRIEVADTGSGPPDALAGSLFDPFVTGKATGVGLGLALARRVATDHQGVLSWSRSGGFTRFRLELPLMNLVE